MILSCASDLRTRQTVWVRRSVTTDEQRNSHNAPRGDGLTAAVWANLATDYEGWQGPGPRYWHAPGAKRLSFLA